MVGTDPDRDGVGHFHVAEADDGERAACVVGDVGVGAVGRDRSDVRLFKAGEGLDRPQGVAVEDRDLAGLRADDDHDATIA